jgi:hypothetical protein
MSMPSRLPRALMLSAVVCLAFLAGRWSSATPAPPPVADVSHGTPSASLPGATPPVAPASAPVSPAANPSAAGSTAEVDALKGRLVGAYVVGGAADPIEFPEDVAPAYTPEAVQAWVHRLRAQCPAAAAATIEVDCGEYPCVVAAAWIGDAKSSDVACVRPELAGGRQGEFSGKVDGDWLRGVMLPVGPATWTGPGDVAQFDRRWEIRSRELRALLMGRLMEEQQTRTP